MDGHSRFGDAGFRILLDASVDLVAHKAGNEIADFGVIEKPYDLVAVTVHPPNDKLFELSVEDVSEVVDGIGLPGIAHRFVGGRIGVISKDGPQQRSSRKVPR